MKTEIEIIDEEIATKEAEIEKLKAHRITIKETPENQRLANYLHSLLCRWNHTDGCGWEYRKADDWIDPDKKRYLEMVDRALTKFPYETIMGVLKAIHK